MRRASIAAVFALLATAWDSRNISASEWECSPAPAAVGVAFAGAPAVDCSTEILQNIAQAPPSVQFYNASAATDTLYTVIVVDRDAPSATTPTRSPLRHYAAGGIPRAALAAGVNLTLGAADDGGATAWYNFSGPQPPPGSFCHSYYVMVYAHASGAPPPALPDPSQRYLWDFPAWAANNSLAKAGVNYWQTQNLSARTAACPAGGGGSGASGSGRLSAGAIAGIAVAAAVVAAASALGAVQWWKQRRPSSAASFRAPGAATPGYAPLTGTAAGSLAASGSG